MRESAFRTRTMWQAFDARRVGILAQYERNAYGGVIFDGRDLYYTPSRQEGIAFAGPNVIFHGRVLRFDTRGDFYDEASWAAYDAKTTDGMDTRGYAGGVFDGRYVYFAPWCSQGFDHHARVLRYDTRAQGFDVPSSWSAYDAGRTDGEGNCHGYNGAVFDGRHVYFIPLFNNELVNHGRVLRYDTEGDDFKNPARWEAYDAKDTDGIQNVGYCGAVFDGRHVYFVPSASSTSPMDAKSHAHVLRYDTKGAGFRNAGSWRAFDAGRTDGMETRGYSGGVFDGRHVYFVPNYLIGESWHARVLRYDTRKGFQEAASWEAFDAAGTDNLPTVGFAGGAFDGRYVYFTPRNQKGRHLRYDTQSSFRESASWEAFDAGHVDNLVTEGFINAAFDGKYVYFVPHIDSANTYHCRALRFKAREDALLPPSIFGGSFY